MSRKIIIEIRDNMLVQVTIDPPESDTTVILVDWDNIKEGAQAEFVTTSPIENLNDSTLAELEKISLTI